MKEPTVAIAFPFLLTNDGDYSLLKAIMSVLSERFPKMKFVILLWRSPGKLYVERVDFIAFNVPAPKIPGGSLDMVMWFSQALLYRLLGVKPSSTFLRAIADSDVALAPSRDMLVMNGLGGLTSFLYSLFWVMLPKVLGKPTILLSADFMPGKGFKRKLLAPLLRSLMSSLELLIVRNEKSRQNLLEMGIPPHKVMVVTDSSFLLRPIGREEAIKILNAEGVPVHHKPLIGLSIHPLLHKARRRSLSTSWREVAAILAEALDRLIEELNAIVVFVPRVSIFGESDRTLAKEVKSLMRHKERYILLSRKYRPEQIRAIIGVFDLLIALPFHALVHAVSMGVPAVAVDYGGKTLELMRSLDLEGLVIPAQELTPEAIVQRAIFVWSARDRIRAKLLEAKERLRKEAMKGLEAFSEFLGLSMSKTA